MIAFMAAAVLEASTHTPEAKHPSGLLERYRHVSPFVLSAALFGAIMLCPGPATSIALPATVVGLAAADAVLWRVATLLLLKRLGVAREAAVARYKERLPAILSEIRSEVIRTPRGETVATVRRLAQEATGLAAAAARGRTVLPLVYILRTMSHAACPAAVHFLATWRSARPWCRAMENPPACWRTPGGRSDGCGNGSASSADSRSKESCQTGHLRVKPSRRRGRRAQETCHMGNAPAFRETKAVTIRGRAIPGAIIAAVRERMKTRPFREGEVITWLKDAGLQGLAAVSLHAEFVKREVKAGRIREEDNLFVAVEPATSIAPEA